MRGGFREAAGQSGGGGCGGVGEEEGAGGGGKREGNPVPANQLMKQAEIAESGFRGKELRRQDFAGGVVLHAEGGEERAAAFEPVVQTAVELHEFSELCGTHPALAMRGSSALSSRLLKNRAEPAISRLV